MENQTGLKPKREPNASGLASKQPLVLHNRRNREPNTRLWLCTAAVIAAATVGVNQTAQGAPSPDPAPVEHPPAGIDCTYACVQRVKRNIRADLHRRHKARARMIALMPVATASWYDDQGQTASGRHYRYGFAALRYGSEWGKRVRFCYRMRCHIGRLQDHGPYIAGRSFDLNPALKAALGCGDLCAVHFRALP